MIRIHSGDLIWLEYLMIAGLVINLILIIYNLKIMKIFIKKLKNNENCGREGWEYRRGGD